MNTVRKHSCLLVNWNGRPFPLTSSRRWCCISLFQAVALVVVIVLNYFWPLDVGVLHALLFLFAVVRSKVSKVWDHPGGDTGWDRFLLVVPWLCFPPYSYQWSWTLPGGRECQTFLIYCSFWSGHCRRLWNEISSGTWSHLLYYSLSIFFFWSASRALLISSSVACLPGKSRRCQWRKIIAAGGRLVAGWGVCL
jgi:hypothetical protein